MNGAGGACITKLMTVSSSGRGLRGRDDAGDHLGRRRQGQAATDDQPGVDQPVHEARHDADVAAATADRPEQVGVALLVDGQDPAVGGHDLGRDQVVDRHAVLAGEEADAATGRQAADADAGRVTERDGEAVLGRGRGHLAGRQAGLGPGQAPIWIDQEALHRGEVEDDAALRRAVTRQAVAAAPDRELETRLGREEHGPRDVGGVRRLDDDRRDAVEPAVVDLARLIEARVAGHDERAAQRGAEGGEAGRADPGDRRGGGRGVGRGEGRGADGFHGWGLPEAFRSDGGALDRPYGSPAEPPTDAGRQPGSPGDGVPGGRMTMAAGCGRVASGHGPAPGPAGDQLRREPSRRASGRKRRSRRWSRRISRSMIRRSARRRASLVGISRSAWRRGDSTWRIPDSR